MDGMHSTSTHGNSVAGIYYSSAAAHLGIRPPVKGLDYGVFEEQWCGSNLGRVAGCCSE
jgi:hypothetical protein